MQETTKAMACPSNKARHLLRRDGRCRCRRFCRANHQQDEEDEEDACLVDVITESVSSE